MKTKLAVIGLAANLLAGAAAQAQGLTQPWDTTTPLTAEDRATIASTVQQMSISFGVATASLVTGFFIPDRFHSTAAQMIHGIHEAFLVLGALTVFSTVIFGDLKSGDGDNVSQHNLVHAE